MNEGEEIIYFNANSVIDSLTIGKRYIILRKTTSKTSHLENSVYIKNDNNKYVFYDANFFITISEYRDIKLNKLWK